MQISTYIEDAAVVGSDKALGDVLVSSVPSDEVHSRQL